MSSTGNASEEEEIWYCDTWLDELERVNWYTKGGYHPVMLGDILHDRYQIALKLGSGGFSTVWLARDLQQEKYVALKINIAMWENEEISVLSELSLPSSSALSEHPGRTSVPLILDKFEVHGPNGDHTCYTTSPARSHLDAAYVNDLFIPLDNARAMSYELTLALAYVHSRGYVHGDIHPRNILIRLSDEIDKLSINGLYRRYGEPLTEAVQRRDRKPLPPDVVPAELVGPHILEGRGHKMTIYNTRLLLSDFGNAFAPGGKKFLGMECGTPPAHRAPEATVDPRSEISYSYDIWSLSTTLWLILGRRSLVDRSTFSDADATIAQIIEILGPMPPEWTQKWAASSKYLNDDGYVKRRAWKGRKPGLEGAFKDCIQFFRRKYEKEIKAAEKRAFLKLMGRMLSYIPEERPTVEDVLLSEWMLRYALPEYLRSLGSEGEK